MSRMIPQMIDPLIKTMMPMIATITAMIHKRLADITTSCGHGNDPVQTNRGSPPVRRRLDELVELPLGVWSGEGGVADTDQVSRSGILRGDGSGRPEATATATMRGAVPGRATKPGPVGAASANCRPLFGVACHGEGITGLARTMESSDGSGRFTAQKVPGDTGRAERSRIRQFEALSRPSSRRLVSGSATRVGG